MPFRKTSRLGPDKGGCRIPTKAGTVSLRKPICKDCRIRKDEDTSLPNVVLVHTPQSQAREDFESIAARTGLPVRRVNECLRLLQKHACIRSQGAAENGAPVYVLNPA